MVNNGSSTIEEDQKILICLSETKICDSMHFDTHNSSMKGQKILNIPS
jgi:hypothetical protein